MIVRINQTDPSRAEQDAGWGMIGAMRDGLPRDYRAFELLILGQDEQNRPLSEIFRQTQLRQMFPQAVAALLDPGDVPVARLDGPLVEGELLGAFRWLTETGGFGRYAFSGATKVQTEPAEVNGSVRIQTSPRSLALMCSDPGVGLERSVRLCVLAVPDDWVNPLLAIAEPGDERWPSVLAQAGLMVVTTRGMRSLQILTRRHDAVAVKARIMHRLKSVAAAAAHAGI